MTIQENVRRASWLLLLHQIPAKPDYLRVKIWRRMQRIGAVPLKNAAWVLPADESNREDFEWLAREIEAEGGDAVVCDARFIRGLSAEQAATLQKLIAAPSVLTQPMEAPTRVEGVPPGSVWVTRRNVFVDRIASAWLIRRHIDPKAHFKFVDDDYSPADGEIRFDMYGGEFTHIGDACTFEVLASTFVAHDPAIAMIAEIVHDIDLKDERYGRAEAAGLDLALAGMCATTDSDPDRLAKGAHLFEWLCAAPPSDSRS
jgi:hypothetical protein